MTRAARLGLLGGTFDPVHFGHLDAAEAASRALTLDGVLFIPAHDPPHKPVDPRASAFHRFALLTLAIAGHEGWRISDMELAREGTSYTIDTLRALHREGWDPARLFFVLGADAFAEVATWREYPAVLEAAHFVVIARPGRHLEAAMARAPEASARIRRADDVNGSGTGVFLVEARTRDVSSTTIRARLAAGTSIGDLVPAAVERHILAHHLYDR